MNNHLVLYDTQITPTSDVRMVDWFGQLIIDRMPEVLIVIGDWWDMKSLSSYDKSTKAAEGQRYFEDVQCGKSAMARMLKPMKEHNERRRRNKQAIYKPRMEFFMGNHEERIIRHVNANPSLHGTLGYADLQLDAFGWNVTDFLEHKVIDGINYTHCVKNRNSQYMKANPKQIIAQEMMTTVVGHQPGMQIYCDYSSLTEKNVWGIINGASYLDNPNYRNHTGNNHFRGVTMFNNVEDGDFDLELIRLSTLEKMYD